MILIVCYDLKTTKDYSSLYEALKSQGEWWHYLGSTWLISTPKRAHEVAALLRAHIAPQDFLLVVQMGKEYNGSLPADAWQWIANHLAPKTFEEYLKQRPLAGMPPWMPREEKK